MKVQKLKPVQADLVVHGLASAAIFPHPYRGKGTMPGWDVEEWRNVSIASWNGTIAWIGPASEVSKSVNITEETYFLNGQGLTAIPGFVDSHTHLVYAGDRSEEFEMRVKGRSYLEILEAGGGILRTVEAVRASSEDELFDLSAARLWQAIEWGTTTIEVKSGYGLDLQNELKMLRVIRQLEEELPITVIPTFMGAHAVPHQYKKNPDKFVDEICDKWIPEVAKSNLAIFNDVFTESKAFDVAQSRRILKTGKKYGLLPKIHADEITCIGAIDLAVEMKAVSADHLLVTGNDGIRKLVGSGVIPTVLPGTSTFLMEKHHARVREMIEAGLPIAIASDHNPGSCQFLGAGLIQTLAMLQLKMSAAEALIAGTLHAAHALNLGKLTGAIEVGRRMDLALIEAPSYKNIGYHAGTNLVHTVIAKGIPINIRH